MLFEAFLRLQVKRQLHVFQRRILREKIEALKHQPETQAVLPKHGVGIFFLRVEYLLSAYGNASAFGHFEKIETAQQGGFAVARGADYGNNLTLFEGEADSFQHLGIPEAFAQIFNFQKGHIFSPCLPSNAVIAHFLFEVIEQQRQNSHKEQVKNARIEQRPDDADCCVPFGGQI